MWNCAPSIAPIVKEDKFNQNQCLQNTLEKYQKSNILYAFAVGSFMYIQDCTRPDFVFAVRMLGRFQSNLGIDH